MMKFIWNFIVIVSFFFCLSGTSMAQVVSSSLPVTTVALVPTTPVNSISSSETEWGFQPMGK